MAQRTGRVLQGLSTSGRLIEAIMEGAVGGAGDCQLDDEEGYLFSQYCCAIAMMNQGTSIATARKMTPATVWSQSFGPCGCRGSTARS